MNNNISRRCGIFAAAAAVLAAAAAVLLFLRLENDFDFSIRHFTCGTGALVLTFLPIVLGVLLALAAGFAVGKKPLPENVSFSSLFPTFAAALLACLLAASCVFDFMNASATAGAYSASLVGTYTALLRVRGVLSLLSAVYFVVVVIGQGRIKPDAPVARWSVLLPLVWALLTTICLYFDGRMPINDPIKALTMLFSIGLVAAAVAEGRLRFRRGTCAVPAVLLTFAVAVGGIAVAALASAVREAVSNLPSAFGFSVMESALYTAAFLFAAARLTSLGKEVPASDVVEAPKA